jgi:hypothetical protein
MSRQLSAILVACLLAAFAPSRALAAQADYAGSWSVLVVTTAGNCDKAFRYSVRIARNGVITYGGPSDFTASGQVAANGAVRVRISRGSDYAQGSGRLRGARGSGSWISPSGGCRGRWEADRRSS